MRTITTVLALATLAVAFNGWTDRPDAEARVARIKDAADRSQRADTACRAYLDKLKQLAPEAEKSESFVNRSSALAVLARVGDYPGTPLATSEALEELLRLDELPGARSADDTRIALARLSDCHSVEFYGVMTRLIRSRQRLTPPERLRLRNEVLGYLWKETNGGAKRLIQIDKLISLLGMSIDDRVFPASAEVRFDAKMLAWRSSRVRSENAERFQAYEEALGILPPEQGILGTQLALAVLAEERWQLEKSEELRAELSDVLALAVGGLGNLPQPALPAPDPAGSLTLSESPSQRSSTSRGRAPSAGPTIPRDSIVSIMRAARL